jgi:hypothetical protein
MEDDLEMLKDDLVIMEDDKQCQNGSKFESFWRSSLSVQMIEDNLEMMEDDLEMIEDDRAMMADILERL